MIDPLNLPRLTQVVLNQKNVRPAQGKEDLPSIRFYLFDILGSLEKKLPPCLVLGQDTFSS